MKTPKEAFGKMKRMIRQEWKLAFGAAFLIGLLVHLPAMLSDVPNHDGLVSMYFDQNMITSGRWFLTVACGFSSYFTLPWVIGLIGLFFLSCTAAALSELLELKRTWVIVAVSGLLVTFPALASTFAYVFTMDGYMLSLLLAVLAVLFTKKYRHGFLAGAVCLAFSMGTYQAYVAFAILLCIYEIVICMIGDDSPKGKIKTLFNYLTMGVLGCGFYFAILQLLLKVQGKQLADYQGISEMGNANAASTGVLSAIKEMYYDFAAFSLKGNVLFNNAYAIAAWVISVMAAAGVLITLCFRRKWWKKPGFFVIIVLLAAGLPLATNAILLISPNVTYHLLMRYQWVVYPILCLAFCDRYLEENKRATVMEWGLLCAAAILIFNYSVTDNIGYSNLQKRYEKTYAYCVRLLDRIEQTEGYYQGIPIAMIGVVGEDEYPSTDITNKITGGMIGLNGDFLLYTSPNYEAFMKNYLGATLNFMKVDDVTEIYYSDEYVEMDGFPGPESTKVVDGILYVKTENADRG